MGIQIFNKPWGDEAMKGLLLTLCLALCVAVTDAQKSFEAANSITTNTDQNAEAKLHLSTSIMEQQYSVRAGSRLLRLLLNLTYVNMGERPILIDKKSSLIYRKMISRNLKAATDKKYEYDESSSFSDVSSMQAAGFQVDMRIAPEKEAFITLKSGESYSLKKEVILRLYDGTKDTEEFLHPGTHFLQLRVATWYYFTDPAIYQNQWRDQGYVWSQNITSEPMSFKVEKFF
jgi:hypothetical protein